MKGHMHPESYRGFRELLKRKGHIDCGCKFELLFRADLRKGPWQNLIDYRKKATLSRRRKEIHIDFDDDMDRTSIKEYRSLLPQDIKHGLEGNLLIIQTPERFDDWINVGKKVSRWMFWKR